MDEGYMDTKCQFKPPYMGGCPDFEPKTIETNMGTNKNRNLSQETANCDNQFDKILKMNTEAERRKIATMAMQGLLGNASIIVDALTDKDKKDLAEVSVDIADALIAELNKKKDGSK